MLINVKVNIKSYSFCCLVIFYAYFCIIKNRKS
nr:MAG TPA: hypothetical protein [Caudoviricetes sp.]